MKKATMFFAATLIILLLNPAIELFAGGQSQTQRTGGWEDSPTANFTGSRRSYSGFPLPVTERPVELTAMLSHSALRPNMETTRVWDWFFEQTNVRVRPVMVNDSDRAAVLFASRDFPDFYISGASANLLNTAARDGDILPLDDLLRLHAPTWNNFINENPIVKNGVSLDGSIYYLPFIQWAPSDRDLRDQWLITQSWLDELGIRMPTTTDEFRTAMLAIRNNAGRGSIPQNVLPFYYSFDSYIGGQFDVYGSFGVVVTSADHLAVENGRVIYQAINPDIRAPLRWLQELYREGITPPECFTDDWSTYLAKTSANPPIVGSYGSYANRNPATQAPMPPLQSPTGRRPVMRRQAYIANAAQRFAIFENCIDPVAITRFVEFIAFDIEASMTSTRGLQDVLWRFRPDGKVEQIFWEESPNLMTSNAQSLGLWNSFIALWDRNFYSNLYFDVDDATVRSRGWAFENVYRNHLAPEGSTYISVALSPDETAQMNAYGTDINNERSQTFARWITTDANIDAEWDAYIARMNRLNLTEWLALRQRAYDLLVR